MDGNYISVWRLKGYSQRGSSYFFFMFSYLTQFSTEKYIHWVMRFQKCDFLSCTNATKGDETAVGQGSSKKNKTR